MVTAAKIVALITAARNFIAEGTINGIIRRACIKHITIAYIIYNIITDGNGNILLTVEHTVADKHSRRLKIFINGIAYLYIRRKSIRRKLFIFGIFTA